jgi:Ca2+-binding EF-hand superfamily protein
LDASSVPAAPQRPRLGGASAGTMSATPLRSSPMYEREFDETEEQVLARQLAEEQEAAALFAALDVNRSGEVELAEAKRSLPTLGWHEMSDGYIDGLWRVYDIDGSGALGPDEFGRLLRVLRSRGRRELSRPQLSVASISNPLAAPERPYGQPLPGTPPRPAHAAREQAPSAAAWPTAQPEPEPELAFAPSAKQMIDANESEMTEDEMSDLMYAFQAADMDGSGAIDTTEFKMMLEVMGCQITTQQVQQVIDDAKAGFRAWLKSSDEENLVKIRQIWEEFDADKSGTMDLQEINAVIRKLQAMGHKPEPMSSADLADGELSFDEFSAWFLKQEGLPDDFAAPKDGATGGLGRKQGKKKQGGDAAKGGEGALQRFITPFVSMTKKVVTGPTDLLSRSMKTKSGSGGASGESSSDADVQQMLQDADDNNEVIFAEYVFMMRGGALKQFLPGQWQERAADMRKLRDAFGTADVDGNNQLELEELEVRRQSTKLC